MKSKILKIGGFLLGAMVLGIATLLFFGGDEKIGEINIQNGKGQFESPGFKVQVNTPTAQSGQLTVATSSLPAPKEIFGTVDYMPAETYILEGEGQLFDGEITLEIPIPEALQGKPDLAQKLTLVTLESGMNHWGEERPVSRSYPVQINSEKQTFSATIQPKGIDGPLGQYDKDRPARGILSMAAPPPENEGKKKVKFTYKYSEDAKVISGKHFQMNLDGIDVSHKTIKKRLIDIVKHLDASFYKLQQMGFDMKQISTPVEVNLYEYDDDLNTQYGEMSSSRFFRGQGTMYLNKKLLLDPQIDADELTTLRSTASHEFFHLVQGAYWRKSHWQRFSYTTFIWLDEAASTSFEMLMSKDKTFDPSVMRTNMGDLINTSLLLANEQDKSAKELESFGYGMAYVFRYLMHQHPSREKVLTQIYRQVADEKASPKKALHDALADCGGADRFWLKLLQEALMRPQNVHPSLSVKMDWSQNQFIGKGAGSGTDAHLIFEKYKKPARPNILKSKGKNNIVFETELYNLSVEPIILRLDAKDPIVNQLRQSMGRKYTVSVAGDAHTAAMIYSYKRGQSSGQRVFPVTNRPNNLLRAGQIAQFSDIDYLYVLLVNDDPSIAELKKRKIKVTFDFEAGEHFEDIAPPPAQDAIDAKVLKELQEWEAYCHKQKQPQQQSNSMLQAYYANKEKELEQAIRLLKSGTDFYGEMNLPIRPENPASLVQGDISASIQRIEQVQDFAFNAKIKLEEALDSNTPEVAADRAAYQLSAETFDYRQVAYWKLLEYLKAVEESQNVAIEPPPSRPPSPPSKPKGDNTFYLGTWRVIDNILDTEVGRITLSPNSLSANLYYKSKEYPFTNIPYEVSTTSFSYEGKEISCAIISIKTNHNISAYGPYYCPGKSDRNMCISMSKFMIYQSPVNLYGKATQGEASWFHYQFLPEYNDFIQGGQGGRVVR